MSGFFDMFSKPFVRIKFHPPSTPQTQNYLVSPMNKIAYKQLLVITTEIQIKHNKSRKLDYKIQYPCVMEIDTFH